MSFQYVQPSQENIFPGLQQAPPPRRSAQPAGGSMSLGGLSKLMGGGGGMATSGSAVSGGSSAGAGGGSALAAAGPWAALAAIIAANEIYAREEEGNRAEDPMEHARDMFSGEVLNQDIEGRWLPMLGIDEDSKWNKGLSFLMNPISADPEKSWGRAKNVWESIF